MKLSILTPAVPSRLLAVIRLVGELGRQIGDLPVEHLVLIDNKRRTVGEKRDALIRAARGEYVAYVDDDDTVSPDYVSEIIKATVTRPDVITFEQEASVNGLKSHVIFGLHNPNEGFNAGGVTLRDAWHICAWRRTLAICSSFPPSNYGEDWQFAGPLCAVANTSVHIAKILHYYRHSAETTEAPPP